MIRAPHIDHPLETAGVFVLVIGDVGGEIGGQPVVANHNAIFFVAKGAGCKPQGPIAFVDAAAAAEIADDPVDRAGVIQALLAEPDIKAYAEVFQIAANAVEDRIGCQPRAGVDRVLFALRNQLIAHVFLDLKRQLADVFSLIAVCRKIDFPAEQLPVAQIDRQSEGADLAAGIVDVVFFFDVKAAKSEQVADAVAHRRSPPVTDMQGTGGIGADKLDLHPSSLTER